MTQHEPHYPLLSLQQVQQAAPPRLSAAAELLVLPLTSELAAMEGTVDALERQCADSLECLAAERVTRALIESELRTALRAREEEIAELRDAQVRSAIAERAGRAALRSNLTAVAADLKYQSAEDAAKHAELSQEVAELRRDNAELVGALRVAALQRADAASTAARLWLRATLRGWRAGVRHAQRTRRCLHRVAWALVGEAFVAWCCAAEQQRNRQRNRQRIRDASKSARATVGRRRRHKALLQWVDGVAEGARARVLCWRGTRLDGRRLCRAALRTWATHTDRWQGERRMHHESSTLWTGRALGVGLAAWQALVRHAQRQRHIRERCGSASDARDAARCVHAWSVWLGLRLDLASRDAILARARRKRLRRCICVWAQNGADSPSRARIGRASAHWRARECARGFNSWRGVSMQSQRSLALMDRALRHMVHRELSRGFHSAVAGAARISHTRRVARKGLSFFTQRQLAMGFGTFRYAIACTQRPTLAMAHRAIAHWLHRGLSRCFRGWCALSVQQRRAIALIGRALLHFMNHKLSRGFSSFLTAAAHAKEVRRCLYSGVGHWLYRGQTRGFNSWRAAHAHRHASVMVMDRALRHMVHRELSRGFHSAVAGAARISHTRRVARKGLSFFTQRQLAMGFGTFRYAVTHSRELTATLFDRALVHGLRLRTRCFERWRQSCKLYGHQAALANRALRRLTQSELSRGFGSYVTASACVREVRRCVYLGVGHWLHRGQTHGFSAWRSTRLAWEHAQSLLHAHLDRAVKHWQHAHCSYGFARLRLNASRRAMACTLVARALGHHVPRAQTQTLYTWLEVTSRGQHATTALVAAFSSVGKRSKLANMLARWRCAATLSRGCTELMQVARHHRFLMHASRGCLALLTTWAECTRARAALLKGLRHVIMCRLANGWRAWAATSTMRALSARLMLRARASHRRLQLLHGWAMQRSAARWRAQSLFLDQASIRHRRGRRLALGCARWHAAAKLIRRRLQCSGKLDSALATWQRRVRGHSWTSWRAVCQGCSRIRALADASHAHWLRLRLACILVSWREGVLQRHRHIAATKSRSRAAGHWRRRQRSCGWLAWHVAWAESVRRRTVASREDELRRRHMSWVRLCCIRMWRGITMPSLTPFVCAQARRMLGHAWACWVALDAARRQWHLRLAQGIAYAMNRERHSIRGALMRWQEFRMRRRHRHFLEDRLALRAARYHSMWTLVAAWVRLRRHTTHCHIVAERTGRAQYHWASAARSRAWTHWLAVWCSALGSRWARGCILRDAAHTRRHSQSGALDLSAISPAMRPTPRTPGQPAAAGNRSLTSPRVLAMLHRHGSPWP